MSKIKQNCIIPSSVFTITRNQIREFKKIDKKPEIGDVVYGEIISLGEHLSLESINGRIHTIHEGTRAVFTLGNRYAPDCFEGFIPETLPDELDMLARSGVVGLIKAKNDIVSHPTRVKILGYVYDQDENILNTKSNVLINAESQNDVKERAKIILCIGTAMNSGKSYSAAACCYALSSMGKNVRAAKVTGTASLKDILLMEDCGASNIADFSYLGYPSTYMLNEDELFNIFNTIDMKYGNNPDDYLVMEFADGIIQRETAMLLKMPEVLKRIHKIIFCAQDAFGAYGGVQVLKNQFNIVPNAISGLCSISPLAIQELQTLTDIPIMYSAERDFKKIYNIIH